MPDRGRRLCRLAARLATPASIRSAGLYAFYDDMALSKTFSITERFKAQFRFDAYNVLNHPVRAIPGKYMRRLRRQLRADHRHRSRRRSRFSCGHAPASVGRPFDFVSSIHPSARRGAFRRASRFFVSRTLSLCARI